MIQDTFGLKEHLEREANRAQVELAEMQKKALEIQNEMKVVAKWQMWFSLALVATTIVNVIVFAKSVGLF